MYPAVTRLSSPRTALPSRATQSVFGRYTVGAVREKGRFREYPSVEALRAMPVLGTPLLCPSSREVFRRQRWAFIPIGVFVSVLCLSLWLVGRFTEVGWFIGLTGFVAAIGGAFALVQPTTFACWRAEKRSVWADLEAKNGAVPLAGVFVGVSFTSEWWQVGDDTAWDTGSLVVDWDRISFRGLRVDFDIPASLIEQVTIKIAKGGLCTRVANLYVSWRGSDGAEQFVCIEPRDARNCGERLDDVLSLQSRMVALRDGPKIPSVDLAALPAKSSEMPLRQSAILTACLLAKVLGVVVGLLAIIIFEILGNAFCLFFLRNTLWSIGSQLGMWAGSLAGAMSVPWFDKRLPERWKTAFEVLGRPISFRKKSDDELPGR